jgi:hypothetical protein
MSRPYYEGPGEESVSPGNCVIVVPHSNGRPLISDVDGTGGGGGDGPGGGGDGEGGGGGRHQKKPRCILSMFLMRRLFMKESC